MIYKNTKYGLLKQWLLSLLMVVSGFVAFGKEGDFPERANPPKLVNDYAGMMTNQEEDRLERKLVSMNNTTSTQISVVTIKDLGDYDISDYTIKLFNKWKIGQAGKNNGVLLLVSLNNRKSWITTGKGLEGALTDAQSSAILRNELKPAFKEGKYYAGLDRATDAIIAATKGEYQAEEKEGGGRKSRGGSIIVLIVIIYIILKIFGRGGGRGGGGGYMSNRGFRGIATGMLLNSLLGGGRGGGWGGGSGGGFGGGGSGGFGGFGGGSSGGGGAGGSW